MFNDILINNLFYKHERKIHVEIFLSRKEVHKDHTKMKIKK